MTRSSSRSRSSSSRSRSRSSPSRSAVNGKRTPSKSADNSPKESSEVKDTAEKRSPSRGRSPSDPRERRRRADREDLEACVAHAVEKTNLLKLEDFIEDRLTMRNLEGCYARYGGSFVVELIEEVLHSIGFDVRDRRDILVPHKFAGIRVNRIMRYMEDERRRSGPPKKISVTKLMEKCEISDDRMEERLRSLTQRQLRKVCEDIGEGEEGRRRLEDRLDMRSKSGRRHRSRSRS